MSGPPATTTGTAPCSIAHWLATRGTVVSTRMGTPGGREGVGAGLGWVGG